MIQRLQQLQKRNRQFIPFSPAPLSAETLSPYQVPYQIEGIQQQFFKKVVHARALIQRLKQNNESMIQINNKYKKAIKNQQQKSCSSQMEIITTQNSSIHSAVKKLLQQIKYEIDDCQTNPELKDEPETKTKKNLFLSISSELAKTIEQQRQHQNNYKNTVKNKITRQVRIIDKDITQQDVQHYVENPDQAQQMLQRKVFGQASTTLKNAVSDIQDKFKDIQRLQISVNQCLQLFKQLQNLVYAQGQMIDNIETNVNQAKDYVQKGQKKLAIAKKRHQCTKKCMCWTIIITAIVLTVLLAIVIPVAIKAVK